MNPKPLTAAALRARLDRFERLPLGVYPTPLQPAPGLSRELGRAVLVKREDLSGLAFGGNKVRHMELLMAEVRRAGADTVLNVMGYHSNNARLAAAACVRAGFRYHVFLRHAAGRPVQGNCLVDHLLGAAVHLLNDGESQRAQELARGVAERLRRAGAVPYLMNDEPFPKLAGMIGFAGAGLELADQLQAAGVTGPVRIAGVAGRSLCGLALASLNLGLDWRFTGVRVPSAPPLPDYVFRLAGAVRRRLDLPRTFAPADFDVVDRYAGPGGPAPPVLDAVRLAARADALMVDPNYTGVALAGLIDRIADGGVGADETVVFVHTGGTPAIFSYAQELAPARTLAVTPAE